MVLAPFRLTLLTLTLAGPVRAQNVRGIVLDATSGLAIDQADVVVLAAHDSIVGQHVTDKTGQFAFHLPKAAAYRLRARRIGYASFTTDPFLLVPGQDTLVEVRLQAAAIPLDPVEAVGERQARRLARVGFYDRRAKGFGQFRTPKELETLQPTFPEDLFRGLSGVRILRDGTVVSSTSHGRCALSVAVDGLVVKQGGRWVSSEPWTEFVHVKDIEAIEVYPGPAGVPVWLAGTVSPCGAIVIWTKG